MKLQNINSNYYIHSTHSFRAKSNTKTITKPLEEPIKKSGKTLGGIIMSGLAALDIVSTDKKEENGKEELTDAQFDKIQEKMLKKASNSDLRYLINNWMTKKNIDLFNWILNNWKQGGNRITQKLYRDSNETEKANTLFNTADIPHEDIVGILEKYHWCTNDIKFATELYRLNREKSEEFKPIIEGYEPKTKQEEFNKTTVLKYLSEPHYRQYLDYMTQEKLEKFIKENPISNGEGAGLDVLHSGNEDFFELRLDFSKFLSNLPNSVKWKNLHETKNNENELYNLNQRIFLCIDKDNVDFVKKLIKSENYKIDQVMCIASYTNKDNLETMRTIFNDKRVIEGAKENIIWKQIYKGLSKIDKNNAKRVLELFNMAKLRTYIWSSLEDFALTPQITMKLCKTYKINPLLVAGIDYITPESAPVVKKIADSSKYKYDKKRELCHMASQCREAKKLIEVLVDRECETNDIQDIYRSVFDIRNQRTKINKKPSKADFQAILKIAGFKDINSYQTEHLLFDCYNRPLGFLAKHLVDNKTIDTKYITEYWRYLKQDNLGLVSKLLWNKNFSQEYLKDILSNYKKGSDEDVLSIVESGELDKNKELVNFPTDSWRFILDNKIKFEDIDKKTISYIAKSKNPKLFDLHKQLRHDVYSSKNLLKPGLDDLTNEDLEEFLSNEDTISTLNKVGKGVVTSTFPETIYGVEDFCEDIAEMELPEDLFEELMLKIYPENSKKYKDLEKGVNELKTNYRELLGEENYTNQIELGKQILEIEKFINKENKKESNQKIKELKNKRSAILYNSENVGQIKEVMKEITQKRNDMKAIVAQKVDLSPQKIAEKVRVIAQYAKAYNATSLDEDEFDILKYENLSIMLDLIKSDTEENEMNWNNFIYKLTFAYFDSDISEDKILEKLDLIHSKYLSKMFTSSQEFFDNLEVLIKHINDNIDFPIEKIIDNLPQNIKTKEQFKKRGIDYKKWTKVDKNSYTRVKVKLDAAEAKRAAIENLEEDLNDEMFKKIPVETEFNIQQKIKDAGFELVKDKKVIYDENGFNVGQKDFTKIYKNGKAIEFEDLGKVINAIKEQINNDEFWFKENEVEDVEKAREHLYYHLMKMRVPEFENAKNMKAGEEVNIEVHKTNMYDIKKALGLGNDASCCTALGANFNEWTAPNYIMDKFIGAIELTDRGNFAGNTMMYLAEVDGVLSLVLDNIELKSKYQYNNAIRDAFFEYARKLCVEIGKPDMPIYAGPNRHKVTLDNYEIKTRDMKIIGDSGQSPVYLDFDTEEHDINSNTETFEVELYKIS